MGCAGDVSTRRRPLPNPSFAARISPIMHGVLRMPQPRWPRAMVLRCCWCRWLDFRLRGRRRNNTTRKLNLPVGVSAGKRSFSGRRAQSSENFPRTGIRMKYWSSSRRKSVRDCWCSHRSGSVLGHGGSSECRIACGGVFTGPDTGRARCCSVQGMGARRACPDGIRGNRLHREFGCGAELDRRFAPVGTCGSACRVCGQASQWSSPVGHEHRVVGNLGRRDATCPHGGANETPTSL